MSNRLARILRNENLIVFAAILTLVILAYGLLAPWMGFYWDDWPFVWIYKFFGPREFLKAFNHDRPFLGPIFMMTTSLFGGSPLVWQLVGLLARALLSIELYFLLKLVFPSQKRNVLWVVLLFTVYPGYGQQWVAFNHVNQQFIPLLFLLGSFLVSISMLRKGGSKSLILPAVFLQAVGLFSTEYFFGLEVIRFFLLLKILSEGISEKRELFSKALMRWFPHLALWILSALWFYFFYSSGAYESYGERLFSSALLSPVAIIDELLNTIYLAGFTSWLRAFDLFASVEGSIVQVFTFLLLLVSSFLVFVFMRSANGGEPEKRRPKATGGFGRWAVAIGLVGILAGRLPSWAAGLPLRLEFDFDRFFVSIMLGASLLIIGLADLILKEGKGRLAILSLLIGLCVSQQFWLANTYRRDWENQRAFYWELTWRIPALERNTILLTDDLPLKYVFDLHVTAPLNWMYAESLDGRQLPYMLFYISTRLNSLLPSLKPDTPVHVEFRTARFDGNTSQSISIHKEAGGCLRVLDPVYAGAEAVTSAIGPLTYAIGFSNPSLITSDAPDLALDEKIFGPEPPHGWCYFYAKAELARQTADWDRVVVLYQQAQRERLKVSQPVEYLPFIEAFAMTGDTETATELSQSTVVAQPALCEALIILWDRVSQGSKPAFQCK